MSHYTGRALQNLIREAESTDNRMSDSSDSGDSSDSTVSGVSSDSSCFSLLSFSFPLHSLSHFICLLLLLLIDAVFVHILLS